MRRTPRPFPSVAAQLSALRFGRSRRGSSVPRPHLWSVRHERKEWRSTLRACKLSRRTAALVFLPPLAVVWSQLSGPILSIDADRHPAPAFLRKHFSAPTSAD